jgi:hypothetical protein
MGQSLARVLDLVKTLRTRHCDGLGRFVALSCQILTGRAQIRVPRNVIGLLRY